jgi:hypothetical protein
VRKKNYTQVNKEALFKVRYLSNKTLRDKKLIPKAAKMFMWKLEPEPLFGFRLHAAGAGDERNIYGSTTMHQ